VIDYYLAPLALRRADVLSVIDYYLAPLALRRADVLSMIDYYLAPLAPEERRGEGPGGEGLFLLHVTRINSRIVAITNPPSLSSEYFRVALAMHYNAYSGIPEVLRATRKPWKPRNRGGMSP
jgi:hypothetical protein